MKNTGQENNEVISKQNISWIILWPNSLNQYHDQHKENPEENIHVDIWA